MSPPSTKPAPRPLDLPLLSAPHRLMFATGLGLALLGMLWWAGELLARAGAWSRGSTALPPAWAHGTLMVYGVFPAFFFGFLMTALPKWVSAPPLRPRQYQPAWAGLLTGWALFLGGQWSGNTAGAALGLPLVMAGWAWGTWQLWRACRRPQPVPLERRHAYAAIAALSMGLPGLFCQWLAGLTLTDGNPALWQAWAEALGLWGCLLPVFAIVSHRMFPFFTGAAVPGYRPYRPLPLLWLWLAGLGLHALTPLVGDGPGQHLWLAGADLLALGAAGWFVWQGWRGAGPLHREGMGRLLRVPLVAVLHLGNLWLVIGLALQTAHDLRTAAGLPGWGLAPLHALGIGYCGSLVLGMATRVTLGHSGRQLTQTQGLVWPLFLVFQLLPLLRIAAEFTPGVANSHLLLLTAGGWLLIFGLWAARHGPMYFRARPDGQAG